MGLNDDEYGLILEKLGREPTYTELGMFAVMWSEHCGYKHSKPVLKYFRRYKDAVEGEGLENAGIVDIGDGLGVTMKVESHNHPSAIEPYQGAATGVGGIIRDIFTMGARPIACLNSLRFGPIDDGDDETRQQNRYLFENAVAGIAGYGNCVGVPTVAGEVAFHERYSGNPLVNAMCVGIVALDSIATASASGIGNAVLYLGSATGKDGIHGATFASDVLDDESATNRPNVQIGDPFAEKLLIEATLEALQTGAIVAIQDMGAAGLTCSTIEMSAKGGVGMEIDLDLVPTREDGMSAYEIMLSESQERMLAVAEAGREREVIDVFHKWGLKAVVIGRVIEGREVLAYRHKKLEVQLPAKLLADECPTYLLKPEKPAYHVRAADLDIAAFDDCGDVDSLMRLLEAPEIACKSWVYRQYDQQVQTQTALVPGVGDAAVIAPRGTNKGLALKIDGNARAVYFDPYGGGQLAVCEAARNVACTGAKPRAITDGLNYGNPANRHVAWQFEESVRGIADAAEIMGTPVISGNVSFYNESERGDVLPTPLIGMLGVIENARNRIGFKLPRGSWEIGLISTPIEHNRQLGLGASAYLSYIHGVFDGLPVRPNVDGERQLCGVLVELVGHQKIVAAHDCSEGGLAVALAEIAIVSDCGMSISIGRYQGRIDAALFGEIPGRVIVAYDAANRTEIADCVERNRLRFDVLGQADESVDALRIAIDQDRLDIEVSKMRARFEGSIPNLMRH